MADLGFIPLIFWHPTTALIVPWRFDPVLGTGGGDLCPLLYFFVCILSSTCFGQQFCPLSGALDCAIQLVVCCTQYVAGR